MAVTLLSCRVEVAIDFQRFGVTSSDSFVKSCEASDVNAPPSSAKISNVPAVICTAGYATNASRVVSLDASVCAVFDWAAQAEVFAPVIESVPVDVVYNERTIQHSKYKAVHENVLLRSRPTVFSRRSRFGANGAASVKRIRVLAQLAGLPRDGGNKFNVTTVDCGKVAASKLDHGHDCSFGNTLSGAMATRKVRAFGDQPSHAGSIVGSTWP